MVENDKTSVKVFDASLKMKKTKITFEKGGKVEFLID